MKFLSILAMNAILLTAIYVVMAFIYWGYTKVIGPLKGGLAEVFGVAMLLSIGVLFCHWWITSIAISYSYTSVGYFFFDYLLFTVLLAVAKIKGAAGDLSIFTYLVGIPVVVMHYFLSKKVFAVYFKAQSDKNTAQKRTS